MDRSGQESRDQWTKSRIGPRCRKQTDCSRRVCLLLLNLMHNKLLSSIQSGERRSAFKICGEGFHVTDILVRGPAVKKPRLAKNEKEFICKTDTFVPLYFLLFLECRQVLVPARLVHRYRRTHQELRSPATQRSDKQAAGDQRDSTESQNKNKWEKNKQPTGDRLRDLPELSQEFTDNLEDTETPFPHTFLTTQIRNVLRKWYRQGSTVFILTSQKVEIAKYACEPR